MSTQVLLGRIQPSTTPNMPYNFVASTSAPPSSGQIRLNNADQTIATRAYIHKVDSNGVNRAVWIRYLIDDASIQIKVFTDSVILRGYRVTAAITEHTDYFELTIQWEDGTTVLATPVLVYLNLLLRPEPPQLFIDTAGRDAYGVETFTRMDLISNSLDGFTMLADQILEVRGINSVPRVESVTLDARTDRNFPVQNLRNADLMSSCHPYTPSRYRVRLQAADGRWLYDRMCFASNVRHFISAKEWTTRIGLDIAEWAAT
jgi:hypothetical protein